MVRLACYPIAVAVELLAVARFTHVDRRDAGRSGIIAVVIERTCRWGMLPPEIAVGGDGLANRRRHLFTVRRCE